MMNTARRRPDPEDGPMPGAGAGARGGDRPAAARPAGRVRHATSSGAEAPEIADALGLAEGTVKRQLHAAVHRLRHALSSPT